MEKKSGKYVPERGDLIWLSFDPQSGHEQSGHRPAIVISSREYNEKVGLALCCPVTSKIKDYPFEVRITIKNKIDGVILADQIKKIDWKKRQATYIASALKETLNETVEKLSLLIKS
ncbi:MAG: mRNA interferase MazF [Deltaproteobacteria bacterium ADurb.Bin151]|nr:endoribonuclease MazF [Smithella sp.]OQB55832.1 MAG: mRNA interferase MazF [Deltaproteobacteria bacterium ADurb.Bin151]HPL66435.1 endoribonuclease MazF [Smithellaceae bacterium]